MLIRTEKLKMAKNIFILSFISLFILVPFFITVVGKVPLEKTFSYINESNRDKLLSVSNYSDKYDVYFYAKDHLSKDSFIKTAISELYIYDDYFQLTRRDLDLPHYEISADCNSDILYSKGNINLCSYN